MLVATEIDLPNPFVDLASYPTLSSIETTWDMAVNHATTIVAKLASFWTYEMKHAVVVRTYTRARAYEAFVPQECFVVDFPQTVFGMSFTPQDTLVLVSGYDNRLVEVDLKGNVLQNVVMPGLEGGLCTETHIILSFRSTTRGHVTAPPEDMKRTDVFTHAAAYVYGDFASPVWRSDTCRGGMGLHRDANRLELIGRWCGGGDADGTEGPNEAYGERDAAIMAAAVPTVRTYNTQHGFAYVCDAPYDTHVRYTGVIHGHVPVIISVRMEGGGKLTMHSVDTRQPEWRYIVEGLGLFHAACTLGSEGMLCLVAHDECTMHVRAKDVPSDDVADVAASVAHLHIMENEGNRSAQTTSA